jgi:23S rRNA (cytosine1962-C5)-methyltransferase
MPPAIRLLPGGDRRAQSGHPWIYSNEIDMTSATKALAPGTIVIAERAQGQAIGVGFFNPRSLIAFRFLSRTPSKQIDEKFVSRRLDRALRLRQRLYDAPYYRLVHAEADGFPGCVIDRYGNHCVIEPNSAGADRMIDLIAESLDRLIGPKTMLVSAHSPARSLEGLAPALEWRKGSADGPVEITENGAIFLIEPSAGQKTGWFFDQRDNRALMAGLARGLDVLDLYSYLAGFGIQALRAGAKSALAVDRSQAALDLGRQSAERNNVAAGFASECADAFEFLEAAQPEHRSFDMVIADPPAFVKSRKDVNQGSKGYRKLARLAAARVRTGGFLFIASCSHNMPVEDFRREVARGIHEAGRAGRILYARGAAPDHPQHPMLPETAYLKALVLQID